MQLSRFVRASLTHASPYLIDEEYDSYTAEQHATWAKLVEFRHPQIEQHACYEYLDGSTAIGIYDHKLPNLAAITASLVPRTRWNTTPVSRFLPAPAFFQMLGARRFPATTWIRDRENLEYTPEPDIFHDAFGHVPMHALPVFADFLQRYGIICAGIRDPQALEKLGRVFWYTVEFGLFRQRGKTKFFGSGSISSHGESIALIEGRCPVVPFDLDVVLATPVKVDAIHHRLFAIDSFDQMYEALVQVEQRLCGSAVLASQGCN